VKHADGNDSQNIYICDYGSTHGTWINNSRLITGEKTPLIHGDVLTFGVPVDREDRKYPGPQPNIPMIMIQRLTLSIEMYPALAVKCKFDWIDEYEHIYAYYHKVRTDTQSRWPANDEVPIKPSKVETITPPASKLRPSTSTNTFCVPEDDSDVEEISVTKVGYPKAFLQRNFTHPTEPIYVVDDDEGVPEILQKERHANEEPTSSGDPDSRREDVVLEDQDGSADFNDEEESEPESSEPSSIVGSNDRDNSITADLKQAGCYEFEQFSEEDSESDSDSAWDEDAQSVIESSVDDDSYDDEEIYINTNSFVDPSMLSREKIREDAFINSVDSALHVKPEATESKPSIPTANAQYGSQGPSFEPSHSFPPPPISAYDVSPWRLQNFTPSAHTPYPRFEYADGPFSCKYGSVYPRNHFDTIPSAPFREPSPVKGLSPDLTSVSLKRKASEMETQDAQQPEVSVPVSQPDLDSIPKEEVVDAISSALSESEPSNKRVKSSHSPSNAMAGYTATAVISALLGGLGTIVLLAALPAEYFQ